jgi:UTP-glucose-1-phosphate uridylyltransferase
MTNALVDEFDQVFRSSTISAERKAKLAILLHNAFQDWKDVERKKIRWAVIPVAGWQATYLAHRVTARLIRRAIAEAQTCGIIRSVVVVAPSQERALSEELADDAKVSGDMLRGKIRLAVQQDQLGLGRAVTAARKRLPDNEPFALILPDEGVEDCCLASMVDAHDKHKYCVIALRKMRRWDEESYGIALLGEKKDEGLWGVKALQEKPDTKPREPALAVVGRYILIPDIFKVLEGADPDPRTGHIELTGALDKLAQGEPVLGYIYKGKMRTIPLSRNQLKQQLKSFLPLAGD